MNGAYFRTYLTSLLVVYAGLTLATLLFFVHVPPLAYELLQLAALLICILGLLLLFERRITRRIEYRLGTASDLRDSGIVDVQTGSTSSLIDMLSPLLRSERVDMILPSFEYEPYPWGAFELITLVAERGPGQIRLLAPLGRPRVGSGEAPHNHELVLPRGVLEELQRFGEKVSVRHIAASFPGVIIFASRRVLYIPYPPLRTAHHIALWISPYSELGMAYADHFKALWEKATPLEG